jgi:hypothetical protein
MNIINHINDKVTELVAIGLTNGPKVRRALTLAVAAYPNRNPITIVEQQSVLMLLKFHGGDTNYVREEVSICST